MSSISHRQELLRLVLDTSVVVAALRSATGASFRMFELLVEGRFILVATPALFFEYESVLSRPEQMLVHGRFIEEIAIFISALARFTQLVRVNFQWRPQLSDPDDEFVLEAAINGYADAIVTFNFADFLPATPTFGIAVVSPGSIVKERFSQ